MKEILKVERFKEENFMRVTRKDESFEEFTNIWTSIAFPFEKAPGVILVGGVVRDSELIKILDEREFNTLSEGFEAAVGFKETYLFHRLFYQYVPEAKDFAKYYKEMGSENKFSADAALHSENIEFGIALINDHLRENKLIVPAGGLLSQQLQMNWETFSMEKRLNGILALICLIAGIIAGERRCFPEFAL
jgi:hypothetical protein